MTTPDLSITIPTYNRAPYLVHLLESLVRQIEELTHSYEIIISDNASADNTEAVVKSFTNKLQIIYVKRDKNYGPADNRQELIKHARGVIQLNVGDDDDLILSEVDKIMAQMLASPNIGAVYAPWSLYSRIDNTMVAERFYSHERDILIQKGDYDALAALVLNYHVFPEIYMIRTDLLHSVSMVANPLAYWAFVHPAEYLQQTDIAFNNTPYYITITKHFENDNRQPLGSVELLTGWDRYRGGLEYILSRIPGHQLTPEKSTHYLNQIQKTIARWMNVSLKMRLVNQFDPVEIYYLCCRLRAMGYPNLIPDQFDEIRMQAAAYYFLGSPTASDRIDKLVIAGNIPIPFARVLMRYTKVKPIVIENFMPERYPQALTLVPGSVRDLKVKPSTLAEHKIRVMGVGDLMHKFA
jgi:glycosyltransferase involved in cell wall biosynthesis